MIGIGLTLPLPGVELHAHRQPLHALWAAGLDEVWTGEVDGIDGVTQLGLYRGWEPDLAIGVGIVNVFTRTPALLALTAASLGELAPGQACLGLGAGSDVIVERWNGIPFEQPLRRVTDTLRFVRAMLAGEPAPPSSTLAPTAFKLSRRPSSPPMLAVAALGPAMQALAAREADGVILNFLSASDLEQVATNLDAVERTLPSPCRRIVRVFVIPGDGADVELAARRHLAGYLTVDVYARFQRWLGHAAELESMWRAWDRGDRAAAVAALDDDVVSALVLTGGAERVAHEVQRYFAAGADSVTMLPLAPHGRALDPHDLTDFFCQVGSRLMTERAPTDDVLPPQPT